jgi:arginase family enzyme
MKIVSVPRINALGLNGPEKAPNILLKEISHEEVKVNNDNIKEDETKIYNYARENLSDVFYVGGDHSISYPVGSAFLEKYGKDNSLLIVFDAHPDLMPPMPEPTHEEYLMGLINKGWKSENIILIGVREVEPEEQKVIDDLGIKVFNKEDVPEITNYIKEQSVNKNIYLSIDIDAISPELAPGVNYSVSNGLLEEKFFEIYEAVLNLNGLRVIDLVEIVLDKDISGKTVELGKRILDKIKNIA